jgi:hypothetical protein
MSSSVNAVLAPFASPPPTVNLPLSSTVLRLDAPLCDKNKICLSLNPLSGSAPTAISTRGFLLNVVLPFLGALITGAGGNRFFITSREPAE